MIRKNGNIYMVLLGEEEKNPALVIETGKEVPETVKEDENPAGKTLGDGSVHGEPRLPEVPEEKYISEPYVDEPVYNVYTYEKALENALSGFGDRTFSYSPDEDPAYIALRKKYLSDGDRAASETLASAAAATGGIPSSYAVNAATQASARYAGQLAGIMPELYTDAYERFASENDTELSYMELLNTVLNDERAAEAEQKKLALQKYSAEKEWEAEKKASEAGADGAGDDSLTSEQKSLILKTWMVSGLPLTEEDSEKIGYPAGYTYNEYMRTVKDAENTDEKYVDNSGEVTYVHKYDASEINTLKSLCRVSDGTAYDVWDKIDSDGGKNKWQIIAQTIGNDVRLYELYRKWYSERYPG